MIRNLKDMVEHERKFLVNSIEYRESALTKTRIVQGFLNTHPDRTVRIRVRGNQGFITVKGRSDQKGISRFEWEKPITKNEALRLLELCEEGILEKIRYEIPYGQHTFEVDEFHGLNEGLVVAEVELSEEKESFEKPLWLGKEVTGQSKYYNSQLSKNPYTLWKS